MVDFSIRMIECTIQFLLMVFLFLQFAKPKLSVLATYLVLIGYTLVFYSVAFFAFGIDPSENILAIFINISLILFSVFFFKDKIWKKILLYVLYVAVSVLAELITVPAISGIWNKSLSELGTGDAVTIGSNIIVYDVMLFISLGIFIIHSLKGRVNVMVKAYIVMAVFVIFHFLSFIGFSVTIKNPTQPTMISQMVFQLVFLVMLIIVFYLAQKTFKVIRESEELNHERDLQKANYKYYTLASEQFTKISKMRHDTRNQLQTIKYLIANNQKDKAEKIVSEFDDSLNSAKNVQYCDNPVINVVLTLKINSELCKDIKTEVLVEGADNLPLSEYDLTSLFGNLLDNAIENCNKVEDVSKRYIYVRSGIINSVFVLKVSNTYSELPPQKKDGTFKTSKKEDGHGYGMTIMKEIVKKYGGKFSNSLKDDLFVAQVQIPIENKE